MNLWTPPDSSSTDSGDDRDHTGCVTGAGRPTAGTPLTTAQATASPAEEITDEYQPLDDNETTGSSGSEVLEFSPGYLAPGASYR